MCVGVCSTHCEGPTSFQDVGGGNVEGDVPGEGVDPAYHPAP